MRSPAQLLAALLPTPLAGPQGPDEVIAEGETFADLLRARLEPESWLLETSFLIETWQWLGLLALIAVGVLTERIVSHTLRRLAHKAAGLRQVKVDEKHLTRFVRPFGLMVTWWIFVTLLPLLDIENEQVAGALNVVGSFVLAIGAIFAAWRFSDLLCDFLRAKAQQTENKFDDMLVPLLRRTLKTFVVLAGVAFVASKLTDDVWRVIAGVSIGGAVLAFAFKDSVENVFGTFAVLLDKPFELGDWITVDDVDGTVEKVGIRSTRVRTFYNTIITVPNRHFVSAKVDNWGKRRYRRIKMTLGLTYDTPAEKVEAFCEGLREIIRIHPYTRKDYYHVYLNDFGASSLDVLLYCFVETPDWAMELRERHRLMADILRLAEGLGVSFAFPSHSVYMVKPEDLEHPNAPDSDQTGAELGREAGRAVAEATLAPYGSDRPGKVRFIHGSSPISAPGEEVGG